MAEDAGRDPKAITDGQYGLIVATADNRAEWLQSEVRKRKYEQTKALLNALIEEGVATGQLYYFKGEVYRRINTDEDDQEAATLFEKAIETGGSPPSVYRALGLTYWDLGQKKKAHAAFSDYLEREPYAGDTEIIKAYMREIRGEAD